MAEKTIGQIGYEASADYYDQNHDAPFQCRRWEGATEPERQAAEAAASAVWDEAVEACADAIKEVEKELAAEGEVYILVKTAEALRSLKRSDKESGNAS